LFQKEKKQKKELKNFFTCSSPVQTQIRIVLEKERPCNLKTLAISTIPAVPDPLSHAPGAKLIYIYIRVFFFFFF